MVLLYDGLRDLVNQASSRRLSVWRVTRLICSLEDLSGLFDHTSVREEPRVFQISLDFNHCVLCRHHHSQSPARETTPIKQVVYQFNRNAPSYNSIAIV